MRTVSASARARVQSSESTAAVAAEFFSSVLREVGIAFLRGYPSFRDGSLCWVKYLEVRAKVNPALGPRRPFSLARAEPPLRGRCNLRLGFEPVPSPFV